jgi:hypothetical protein
MGGKKSVKRAHIHVALKGISASQDTEIPHRRITSSDRAAALQPKLTEWRMPNAMPGRRTDKGSQPFHNMVWSIWTRIVKWWLDPVERVVRLSEAASPTAVTVATLALTLSFHFYSPPRPYSIILRYPVWAYVRRCVVGVGTQRTHTRILREEKSSLSY